MPRVMMIGDVLTFQTIAPLTRPTPPPITVPRMSASGTGMSFARIALMIAVKPSSEPIDRST